MRYFSQILLLLILVMLLLSACGGYSPALEAQNEWLEAHNKYRCMHGVTLLKWDTVLAEVATWRTINCNRCDHCLDQDSSSIYGKDKKPAENAACYSGSPKDVVDGWYSEVKNYDYDNPQWSINTGHFINVVVSTATKVGCACNETHCYCDYDSKFGTTAAGLKQVVFKPVKTEAQCTAP